MSRALLHLMNRELSKGWRGWSAFYEDLIRKREALRRGLSHMLNRKLSGGWNAWCEMVAMKAEFMQLLRKGLAFMVNSKLALGYGSWLSAHAGSGSAAEGATKVRKKKLTGVPSKVQLSVPGKGKVKTTNMLLQIDNPELDLSGDTGAVGRFNAKRRSVHLDLKGVTYGGSLVKSHTLCTVVVNDGKAEVKEAFNSFVHLAKTADYSDKEEIEGADFDNFDDFELSEGEGDGSAAKGKGKGAGGKRGAKKRASAKQPKKKVRAAPPPRCEWFCSQSLAVAARLVRGEAQGEKVEGGARLSRHTCCSTTLSMSLRTRT